MNAQTETQMQSGRKPRRAAARVTQATPPPATIKDAADLLSRVLAELRDGRISARRAKAIAFGCQVFAELTLGSRLQDLAGRVAKMKAEAAAAGLTSARRNGDAAAEAPAAR